MLNGQMAADGGRGLRRKEEEFEAKCMEKGGSQGGTAMILLDNYQRRCKQKNDRPRQS
jgi:hypothetical protein